MEFQKVLETRRTVRKYSAGVTREQMEELLRAAQEAPSWKNSQTGRYYCVLSESVIDCAILLVSGILLFVFAYTRKSMNRTEGAICVLSYIGYTAYLFIR